MIDFLQESRSLRSDSETISSKIPDFSAKLNEIKESHDADDIARKVPIFCDEATRININTRNESLEGDIHPETGVPYVFKTIELEDGSIVEGVFPEFTSSFDAQIPVDLHEATDSAQFKECNKQLCEYINAQPEEAGKRFSAEQLDDIKNGRTPEGFTWHHSEQPGKIQLVDTEVHAKSAHTGGRVVWGGGNDNR